MSTTSSSPSSRPRLRLRWLLPLAMVACRGGEAHVDEASSSPAVAATVVKPRRGEFDKRLVLTGEIDAVAALELKVPRVPNGKTSIRFLAPEGAEVKTGDVVVELDSTSFLLENKDRMLQLSQAEIDLERQKSLNGVTEADKELDRERMRATLRRAEVDADVPEGILPKRDYLDKQLAVRKARADFEKADEALTTQRNADQTDISLKQIAIDKLRRVVNANTAAIENLTLRSAGPGTVILGDHPEERRKVQEADDVFMGMTVARVTTSGARRVRAWLSDVDDGKVAVGMPARVVLDAHPDRSFAATVRDISPVARAPGDIRAQRRVFIVSVELVDVDEKLLRPGLSARVEVQIDHQQGVLLAPRQAIEWTPEGPRARLAAGGTRRVMIGGCNREVCLVSSGIDEGTLLRAEGS